MYVKTQIGMWFIERDQVAGACYESVS